MNWGSEGQTRLCKAFRCNTQISQEYLMCGWHWRMVPEELKRKIWRLYTQGKRDRVHPTTEYLHAVRDAIRHVKSKTHPDLHNGDYEPEPESVDAVAVADDTELEAPRPLLEGALLVGDRLIWEAGNINAQEKIEIVAYRDADDGRRWYVTRGALGTFENEESRIREACVRDPDY